MIKPAVEGTRLECIRGDEIERTGQLTPNIFKAIQKADKVEVHFIEYSQNDLQAAEKKLEKNLQNREEQEKLLVTPKYCKP